MGKSRMWRQSPECVSHIAHPPSPQPSSAFEGFFDVDTPPSRPLSEAFISGTSTPTGAMGSRPPTLTEILLDVSSPPWTLSAFMAYLSQNHCMETLEFTLDAQRYSAFYNELMIQPTSRCVDSDDRVCSLWEKLMQVYIIPCAPREVNIPAHVRDHLLSLPCGPSPPHPSQLDEAGRIIYELMNDSLLVPFLESVAPMQLDGPSDESARSPRFASHNRMSGPIRSTTSMQGLESDSLTDDSDCNSPPAMEPMTPPTTPPTSEWTFNNPSPGSLQRDGLTRHSDLGQDGEHRDGTTAKYTAKRNRQSMSLVKKSIRVRTRMLVDKAVEPVAIMASQPAQEMEVDFEEQSRLWVGSHNFSDFSHYLPNPSASCESMITSATTIDSQCSCPASQDASPDDTYGWEAELDRRANQEEDDECETIALTYRRANGSKTNLLQRVFKAVSSSS
ncbi:RGS domain-containing protein [Ilyonectria robusta]|uniref:RGS domain-containing protein n=1 Tax=Ilyonectria robusta TaxID=1079257 RepID=UPI001E8D3A1F|nr:RGS domain-containing protein [Ilyonectria robusta]KAH8735337.1 RGS domain-containing protein [Ilyonectria robusta]